VCQQGPGDSGLVVGQDRSVGGAPLDPVPSPVLMDDDEALDGHVDEGSSERLAIVGHARQVPDAAGRHAFGRREQGDDGAALRVFSEAVPHGHVVDEDGDEAKQARNECAVVTEEPADAREDRWLGDIALGPPHSDGQTLARIQDRGGHDGRSAVHPTRNGRSARGGTDRSGVDGDAGDGRRCARRQVDRGRSPLNGKSPAVARDVPVQLVWSLK